MMVVPKDEQENSTTTISYEETNSSFKDANDQREQESSGDRIRRIQGRKVRRHIKKLDELDDSDEEFIGDNSSNRKQKNLTSSRNNSPNRNRINPHFQSKSSEENQSKLIGLKFHNKLLNTGKILTHWSDSQKIVVDFKLIEKTADSIISKFTSGVISATQTKGPSSLESKPLERWSTLESDDKNISDLENRIKPNQKVEEILAKKLQISEENLAENSEKIREEMRSDRDLDRNSDQNAREILDKAMAKATASLDQTQPPPVIFSNLNSWFSNIGSATKIAASATKIAASATMTHAAKQLSNAQNILNQLPIPTMDLNLNSIEESKHNQERALLSDVPEAKNIEDNGDWNDDGWEDEEPIVLAGREKLENETIKSTPKDDDIDNDCWNNNDWDDEPVILAKNYESSINHPSKSAETEPKTKSLDLKPVVVPAENDDGWDDWDNDENGGIQIEENETVCQEMAANQANTNVQDQINEKMDKNEAVLDNFIQGSSNEISESNSEEQITLESETHSIAISADPVKSLDNVQNDDSIKLESSFEQNEPVLTPGNDGWDDWDEDNYDDKEKPKIEEIRIEDQKPTKSKNDDENPVNAKDLIDLDDLEIEGSNNEPLVQSNPFVPSISSINDDDNYNNTNCDIAPSALENLPAQCILEPPVVPSEPIVLDSIVQPVGSDVSLPPTWNPPLVSQNELITPVSMVIPGELPLVADQNISPINPVNVAPLIGIEQQPPPLDPNQNVQQVFDPIQEPFLCICPPYIPPVPSVSGSLDMNYPSPAELTPIGPSVLIDPASVGSVGSINKIVDTNLVQKEEDESKMDIDVVETSPFETPLSVLEHQEPKTEVTEPVIEDIALEVPSSLITEEGEVKIEDLPLDEEPASGWDNLNDSSIEHKVDEIIVDPIVSDSKSNPETLEAMPTNSVLTESSPDQIATSGEILEIVELNSDDQQSSDNTLVQATIVPIIVEEEEEKKETNAEMHNGEGWNDWQDQSIECNDSMVLDKQDNSTIGWNTDGLDDWPEQDIIIDTNETDSVPKIQDSLFIDEPDLEMKEPMALDVPIDDWQDQELMFEPYEMDSVPKIQDSLSIDEPNIEADSNDAPIMEAEPIEIEPVFNENQANVPVALIQDEDFQVSNEDDGDWKWGEDLILDSSIVTANNEGVQDSIPEFEAKSIIEENVEIVKKTQQESEKDFPTSATTPIHKVVKKAEPVWEDDWPEEDLQNVVENKLSEEGVETESPVAPKTVEETETAWDDDHDWDDWQDKVEEPEGYSIEKDSQSDQPQEKPSVEECDIKIEATVEKNIVDKSEPKLDEKVDPISATATTVHKIVKKAEPIWEDDWPEEESSEPKLMTEIEPISAPNKAESVWDDDNGWDDWQEEKAQKPVIDSTAEKQPKEKFSVKKCDPEPENDDWNDWPSEEPLQLPTKRDCESTKPKFNLVDRFEKDESKSKPKPKFALVDDNADDWSDDWNEPTPTKPTASQIPLNRKPEMKNGNHQKQGQIKNQRKPDQPPQTQPPSMSSSAMMMAPSNLSSDQYRQFHRTQNPPTNSSSAGGSWFNDIKAATKTAAVTTVQHAVKNWSFNPISLMDSVVDNLSSAVGVPSAEEMAALMKAKNSGANKSPANR